MAVTAAKSVMAFRVLTMAVDLCRLTTRTMNVNAGHERTSKARIIHQIQLIRGITSHAMPALSKFRILPLTDGLPRRVTGFTAMMNLFLTTGSKRKMSVMPFWLRSVPGQGNGKKTCCWG
ncbi:glutamate decarboxylase isozyme [Shigella dysenteriae 1617]|uniref:Uncharacterized protein n=1 Tax=Shigella dysenteriae serotype 1 (strain Sd197) TaxID=300267 RepID=Q32D02_SHIDS|nr:hypothetical protein SDY_2760 [Shigella dysenteriae Sd197]EFP72520.1 glutamate decarboxylase isozyme [Shigella dysenteriae 1617]